MVNVFVVKYKVYKLLFNFVSFNFSKYVTGTFWSSFEIKTCVLSDFYLFFFSCCFHVDFNRLLLSFSSYVLKMNSSR